MLRCPGDILQQALVSDESTSLVTGVGEKKGFAEIHWALAAPGQEEVAIASKCVAEGKTEYL